MASVYVMRGDKRDGLKIGFSCNPEKRALNLTNDDNGAISLEYSIEVECARSVEQAAHLILDCKRIRGEWFDVTIEEAKCAIVDAMSSILDTSTMSGGEKFRSWMRSNGKTTRDAGKALDMFPNNVSSICSGKIRPSLVNAFKIEIYTNGGVKARDFLDEDDLKLNE